MDFVIRQLTMSDSQSVLSLYNELSLGPQTSDQAAFERVLTHHGTFVYGADENGDIRAMATLHVLPNVTWNARPYGLIENVVTAHTHRGRGLGRAVMEALVGKAWDANAYKVMLLTGQKRGSVGFYEAVGFSGEDKHAMVIRRL